MFNKSVIIFLAFVSCFTVAEPKNIVVTIAPLHSIVVSLTQNVQSPELLLPANVSPHDFQLKPSQRRKLANADRIFWVGHDLETALDNVLLQHSDKLFGLDQFQNQLNLLDNRTDTILESAQDNHEHDSEFDPHFWLDPNNTLQYAQAVTVELINLDPENRQVYKLNLDLFLARLEDKMSAWKTTMLNYSDQPVLAVHDGFQYLENAYSLKHQGALHMNTEVSISLKRMSALKRRIQSANIQCIFSEPQYNPKSINTLVKGLNVNVAVLDPMGSQIKPGPDLYAEMMQANIDAIASCLKP